jgi:hypothetical protein
LGRGRYATTGLGRVTEMAGEPDQAEAEYREDGDREAKRLHVPEWFTEWLKRRKEDDDDGGIRAQSDY